MVGRAIANVCLASLAVLAASTSAYAANAPDSNVSDESALPPLPAPPPPPPASPPSEAEPVAPSASASPALETSRADTPPHRRFQGFYLRTSIGAAGVAAWGSGPIGAVSVTGEGPSLALALGGSVVPGLAIGAAVRLANTTGTFHGSTYAQTSNPTADLFLVEVAALADWYPNPDDGWHVGGQVGVGGVSVTPDQTNVAAQSSALGGALFGGYDWRIRDSRWAFGALAVASGLFPGTLDEPHNTDSGYRMRGFAMSVEGTALFF